jgi:hypothetical protein
VYFLVLDVEVARDRGDQEGALAAEERVREAMKEAGFKDSEIDIDALIEAASEAQEADKEVHEKGYQGEKLA